MQAIITRYIGPRSHGSRIKATAPAGSVYVQVDNALSIDENHRQAAMKLAKRFDWRGTFVVGGLGDGSSVWVCVSNDPRDSFTLGA